MRGCWSVVELIIMYVPGRAAVDQRGVGGRWGSRVVRSLLHPPTARMLHRLTHHTPCDGPCARCSRRQKAIYALA
jgi:hypothetical protein